MILGLLSASSARADESWWETGWAVTGFGGVLTTNKSSDIWLHGDFGLDDDTLFGLAVSKVLYTPNENLDFEFEQGVVKHFGGQSNWEFDSVLLVRWNTFYTNPPLCINEQQLREAFAIIDKGLDIADQAVDLTRQAAEILGLTIDVRPMDAEHMDFADDSFDFVYTWGVIHHSQNTEAVVAEIARVLRPGGRVLCMVYNRDSLRYWLKGLYWLLVRGKVAQGYGFGSVQRFYTDGYYHRHFSKREFVRLFAREGMTLERLSITHMAKRMVPIAPRSVDDWIKDRAGFLMVGEFRR